MPKNISADLHKNRICHVLSAAHTFNDREPYPISDGGAMRYGPIDHVSRVRMRIGVKRPCLVAVGHGLRLWVETVA